MDSYLNKNFGVSTDLAKKSTDLRICIPPYSPPSSKSSTSVKVMVNCNSLCIVSQKRVSMGQKKKAKNLAVRRKNERILTVSRKKMLTIKKSNHKIRSRDLLLSLMCYVCMCSGSENYNRNRKCRKCLHNLTHGCRCAS